MCGSVCTRSCVCVKPGPHAGGWRSKVASGLRLCPGAPFHCFSFVHCPLCVCDVTEMGQMKTAKSPHSASQHHPQLPRLELKPEGVTHFLISLPEILGAVCSSAAGPGGTFASWWNEDDGARGQRARLAPPRASGHQSVIAISSPPE